MTDPLDEFLRRPIVPVDEAARLFGRPGVSLNDYRVPYSLRKALKLLPRADPVRIEAREAQRGLQRLDRPEPRRPLRERAGDFIAGRDAPPRRTNLERGVERLEAGSGLADELRSVDAKIRDTNAEIARIQAYAIDDRSRAAALKGPQEELARLQRRKGEIEGTDLPALRSSGAGTVRSDAQRRFDKAQRLVDQHPLVRDRYNRQVAKAARYRKRMRALGYGALGAVGVGAAAAGGVAYGLLYDQGLARRGIRGTLTEDDERALVDGLGEEGARQFMDEAARAREQGVDPDAIAAEVEAEEAGMTGQSPVEGYLTEVDPETGAVQTWIPGRGYVDVPAQAPGQNDPPYPDMPADELGFTDELEFDPVTLRPRGVPAERVRADLAQRAVAQAPLAGPISPGDDAAGPEVRPPSVFNPPAAGLEPIPVEMELPPEDDAVGPETDPSAQNPYQFFFENQALLDPYFRDQGMGQQEILDLFDGATGDYFRQRVLPGVDLGDDLNGVIGRYAEDPDQNILGDGPRLRAGDRLLERLQRPVADVAADAGMQAEPGSILDGLLRSRAARWFDAGRDMFLPDRTDMPARLPLEVAEGMYTSGSAWGYNPEVQDAVGPVLDEALMALGEAPLRSGRTASGTVPEPDSLVAATPLEIGPGTLPNDLNNPQDWSDLRSINSEGVALGRDLLMFPGGPVANADALGIGDVPPSARQWERQGQIVPDSDMDPDDGALSSGGARLVDPDEVINDIILRDEFTNPERVRPSDRAPDTPGVVEPFSRDNPEIWAADDAEETPFSLLSALGIGPANASSVPETERPAGPERTAPAAPPRMGGLPRLDAPPSAVDLGGAQSDFAAPFVTESPGNGAPVVATSRTQAGADGRAPDGALGDFNRSRSVSAASLADDAEEAERELNGINRWLKARGLDADERDAAAAALIRMGATMMTTPGNFGEGLGAGLAAGLDAYTGSLSEAEAEALAREELDLRRREMEDEAQYRQRVLAMRQAEAAEGRGGGGGDQEVSKEARYLIALQRIESDPAYADHSTEEKRYIARQEAGMTGSPPRSSDPIWGDD